MKTSYSLSDAIREEGFHVTIMEEPWLVPNALGEPLQHMTACVFKHPTEALAGIALSEECWDHAYSASHEIAEYRNHFEHSAGTFSDQANLLSKWIKKLAIGR